ncbi:MAG: UDP-N-acetylglucosamine 2-epimerase (non-hydrolyzing) [bacterium]|nr:UDP-N-acetylglucosamine 2-epimerase (non-hydrolyzing) [bacterium]
MKTKLKIMISLGTRPEAIKLVPLIFKLKDDFEVKVVSSGQHNELLDQVLEFFDVKTDYDLNCMGDVPNLEKLSINIIDTMGGVIEKEKPDMIIVQGDTMTVYQTAFVAFLRQVPIIHLEAGLRTFKKYSPFPEEMLRLLVGRLADFHLCPTEKSKDNLLAEGIREDRILVAGNTVIDALHLAVDKIDETNVFKELEPFNYPIDKLKQGAQTVLLTVHRRENIGQPMKNITRAVKHLAKKFPDIIFTWVLHKNPEVRKMILDEAEGRTENFAMIEPVSYESLVYFMRKSFLMMTDSGGIQEESPTFGKPVIVLRESTERPEVIDSGIGFEVGEGVREERIIELFMKLYNDRELYRSISKKENPFGDGKASDRILQLLLQEDVQAMFKNFPDSADHPLDLSRIQEFG